MSILDHTKLQIGDVADIFDSTCGAQKISGTDTIIEKCNFDTNFLQAAVQPFELLSGGLLGMIFWVVLAISVYLKYGNALLALLVGVPVIMGSAIIFPDGSDIYLTILISLAVCSSIYIMIWKIPRD